MMDKIDNIPKWRVFTSYLIIVFLISMTAVALFVDFCGGTALLVGILLVPSSILAFSLWQKGHKTKVRIIVVLLILGGFLVFIYSPAFESFFGNQDKIFQEIQGNPSLLVVFFVLYLLYMPYLLFYYFPFVSAQIDYCIGPPMLTVVSLTFLILLFSSIRIWQQE
jgi:hypothetical protein